MEPRTRLPGRQRRAQLLDVAAELFAEQGFHGPSMDQLAEAAGVSKPVLYQHFPSKRDLYLALVADAVAQLSERVEGALAETTHNRERVEAAIGAWFGFVQDRRFRLLLVTADLADDDVRESVAGAMRDVERRIADLIAADAGLSQRAAELLASGVRGLAHAGAQWWVAHADDVDRDQAAALLARLAWRGLGSFTPTTSGGG